MIDQQRPIEPPPSIDEILGQQDRIGRVDFTHRLTPVAPPAPEPSPEPEDGAAEEPVAAAAGAADQQAEPAEPEGDGDEADTDDAADEADEADEETGGTGDGDEADDLDPPLATVYPADEPTSVTRRPTAQPTSQVTNLLSLVPAEDTSTVSEDIDDVVDGVIARIREAQHATLVHLEAVEAEAALRCEMLTAQAELDAELIRLHARREAHAIIAAARQRSGVAQPQLAEDQRRRLDQLGEAAMRLAEELEALGVDPDSPDHPFRR